MRPLRFPRLFLSLALLAMFATLALPLTAHAAERATVRAILITATNLKREADPKLAPYEAELQRNLPLSSFRYIGEGSASVSEGAAATISLDRGHRLELESREGKGAGIRVNVQWMNGDTTMMSTSLTLRPGTPVVLGRRPGGDGETPIVLVIAR